MASCGVFAKKSATKKSSVYAASESRVAFLIFAKKIRHTVKPSKYKELGHVVAFVAFSKVGIYSIIQFHVFLFCKNIKNYQ